MSSINHTLRREEREINRRFFSGRESLPTENGYDPVEDFFALNFPDTGNSRSCDFCHSGAGKNECVDEIFGKIHVEYACDPCFASFDDTAEVIH